MDIIGGVGAKACVTGGMAQYARTMAERATTNTPPSPAKAPSDIWQDIFWERDGLKLHARDYPGPAKAKKTAPVILCLPGLTRNARDFDSLAPALATRHRVLAIEFRGRGDSAYDREAARYQPATYAADVLALLDALGITRILTIGTSLGGLVSMLIAALRPGLIAGALLNDVGPEVNPAGIARIRAYVGQAASHKTWVHCARALAADNQAVYPHFTLNDWLQLAKRTFRLTPEGTIIADYDSNIALPFRTMDGAATPAPDMWPLFDGLKGAPLIITRGSKSDILAERTAKKMVTRHGDATLVRVADVGHAPTLDEGDVRAAIDIWLQRIAAG